MIKRIRAAVAIGIMLTMFCGSVSGVADRLQALRHNVLRLHILANSDSPEDQALKLKVRDRLLAHAQELFDGCDTADEMQQRAWEQRDTIQQLAQSVLDENGCHDTVTVRLTEMTFDTRTYEDITMPAGEYAALRILIGNAEGHNWWCVMYPPLCLPAVSPDECFDPETADMLEQPQQYEVRFKCAEVWDRLHRNGS